MEPRATGPEVVHEAAFEITEQAQSNEMTDAKQPHNTDVLHKSAQVCKNNIVYRNSAVFVVTYLLYVESQTAATN